MSGDFILPTVSSPELMDMKDTDTYQRQTGSKALIMVDYSELQEYEERRKILLAAKGKQDDLAARVESLEVKTGKILDILERLEGKLNNAN